MIANVCPGPNWQLQNQCPSGIVGAENITYRYSIKNLKFTDKTCINHSASHRSFETSVQVRAQLEHVESKYRS